MGHVRLPVELTWRPLTRGPTHVDKKDRKKKDCGRCTFLFSGRQSSETATTALWSGRSSADGKKDQLDIVYRRPRTLPGTLPRDSGFETVSTTTPLNPSTGRGDLGTKG